ARIGLCDFSSITLQPWSTTASAHCEPFSKKRLAQGRDLIIQPAAFRELGCGRSNWNFHHANSAYNLLRRSAPQAPDSRKTAQILCAFSPLAGFGLAKLGM